jgi:hypothetical protein
MMSKKTVLHRLGWHLQTAHWLKFGKSLDKHRNCQASTSTYLQVQPQCTYLQVDVPLSEPLLGQGQKRWKELKESDPFPPRTVVERRP